jgi:hypothetical protein
MKHTIDRLAECFTQDDWIGHVTGDYTYSRVYRTCRELPVEQDDLPPRIAQTRQHSARKKARNERAADEAIRSRH